MSETKTPSQLVGAATDVPDLATKAFNSPALQAALIRLATQFMADRSLLGTKTFWVTFLTPLIVGFGAHVGFSIDEATSAELAAGTVTVAAWIMRYVSKTSVTSVLPQTPKAAA
jgi:hypothetical protein